MGPSPRTTLDSWKEIANYLKIPVRTVQRWEKDEGLPVHRHPHTRQDTVYAYKEEIDAWRSDRDRYAATAGSTSRSTELARLQAELKTAAPAVPPAVLRLLQGPFLIAEALEELRKDNLSRVAADLAIHYEAAREFERAAHWFLRAARNAATVFANHEASDLCRRAIGSADRLEPPQRNPLVIEAALLQAELHLNVSEFEPLQTRFRECPVGSRVWSVSVIDRRVNRAGSDS